MPIIKVRHSITNEMRRLTVPDWPSLEALDRHLRVLFRDELPNPYALRYTDPDGDAISIYSNLELVEAQRSSGSSGTLLLVLSPSTAGESGSFSGGLSRLPPLRSSMLSSFSSAFPGFVSPPPGGSSSSSSSSPSAPLYPFGASSTPLRQTLEGATLPPLKIVEWAPAEFVTGLQFLIAGGNHPEKARDVLIDFGGIVDEAFKAISTSPAAFASFPGAPAIETLNFAPAFTRAVAALEEDGADKRQAVAALIRNGGVLQNAKLEVAGARATHQCSNGHGLGISSYNMGNYATGWFCDRCKKRGSPGQRWKCVDSCEYDVCFDCLPAPPTPAPKEVEAPPVSDNSLPPVLLIPVRQLEAMGFTDRMRIIELIVQHSGDITQAACQLAEERRAQESHAAEEAAREAARQEAERVRREQEEEAARRREEEDRQSALFEENRKKAAELAAAHPEKFGADISYLSALGFDPISSMTSLFNHAGNLEQTIEDLLKRHQPS